MAAATAFLFSSPLIDVNFKLDHCSEPATKNKTKKERKNAILRLRQSRKFYSLHLNWKFKSEKTQRKVETSKSTYEAREKNAMQVGEEKHGQP
jgi:hypothetical protein